MSTSSELRDRVQFPRYFQLLPTDEPMANAYFAVIKQFKWRRVSLIVQDENLFTVVGYMQNTFLFHDFFFQIVDQ